MRAADGWHTLPRLQVVTTYATLSTEFGGKRGATAQVGLPMQLPRCLPGAPGGTRAALASPHSPRAPDRLQACPLLKIKWHRVSLAAGLQGTLLLISQQQAPCGSQAIRAARGLALHRVGTRSCAPLYPPDSIAAGRPQPGC
jgi:hypothetical protein